MCKLIDLKLFFDRGIKKLIFFFIIYTSYDNYKTILKKE